MSQQFKEALEATRQHELKTDPAVYDAVASGAKTHEIRRNDRDFQVGDTLLLRKTRYTGHQMHMRALPLEYTGDECTRVVSHVLDGYGLQDGWVILSFAAHEAVAVQPETEWPVDDWGNPITYSTEAVDMAAHALTGDEGEDDSVTVLESMARYVENVWPGKTALEVLIEYEESRLAAVQPSVDAELLEILAELKEHGMSWDARYDAIIKRAESAHPLQELADESQRLGLDGGWRPIETAPKDRAFLGYQFLDGTGLWVISPMYWSGSEFLILQFHSDNTEHSMQPTHWTEIPDRPRAESQPAPLTDIHGLVAGDAK